MREEPHYERALANWEGEGGSISAASCDLSERQHTRCLPSLPSDYEAQPAWEFRDQTGRFSYEFNRVYGPPNRLDKRGPTGLLDEDLSYWSVIWPTFSETGDERPAGRWVSYAQARKLRISHLTFERFSSLLQMRGELPRLLQVGDVSLEPLPTFTLSAAHEAYRLRGRATDLKPELHSQAPRSLPAPARCEFKTEEPHHGP